MDVSGDEPFPGTQRRAATSKSNGSLAPTFGDGGKAVSDTLQAGEITSDGMIQIDPVCSCEKIIAVGSASSDGLRYSMVARYLF
jgi:hypothetical protein